MRLVRPLESPLRRVASAAALVVLAATSAAAQTAPELPSPSPRARVEQRVGVTDFSVDYSSPGLKGRDVWGTVVPFDTLWRTGANAATKLQASRDFTFGGKAVPAGAYALYTIPGRKSWIVILNTNAEASGTNGYDQKQDVARVTVTPEGLPAPRERLAFQFSDTTDDATKLELEWGKVRVRVPLQVDTKAHVAANIDTALAEAWRPHFASARWLLDSNGDLDKALAYANTSIGIKPTWWNTWIKAQIQGRKGNRAEAVAAAEEAQQLGKGDAVYEGFFKPQVAKAIAEWKQK